MQNEFGKTILGFRGDEPDYSIRGIPWTTTLFNTFKRMKGYDVRPYVASFFAPALTEEQWRVRADYWDVWSTLFAENFFKIQADWCANHHLDYLVHLNHEDKMVDLIRSTGDFFKAMRYVQMPGVDAIGIKYGRRKICRCIPNMLLRLHICSVVHGHLLKVLRHIALSPVSIRLNG